MEKDMKLLEKYMKRLARKYPKAYISATAFGDKAYVNVGYQEHYDKNKHVEYITTWDGKYNDQL